VDVPKIEMAQYLFNDIKFFDKADDFHFTMAFGAHKRINREFSKFCVTV
jgi:hypothetical protein